MCLFMCVYAEVGDGGFRIGSGKRKSRVCCQSSLNISAIICLASFRCALLCMVCVRTGSVCARACVCVCDLLSL